MTDQVVKFAAKTPGLESAIRLVVSHSKLNAAAAAGGNKAREARLVRMQGETLLLAGLQLLDEGEGG
jgi:hypothetical protein